MKKYEFINAVIAARGYTSYLEIGIENPRNNFDHIAAKRKTGVDPNPQFMDKRRKELVVMTSDDFFRFNKKRAEPEAYDVVYIDGLHTFEQTARDIENALAALNPGGVIIVDDVICETEWMGRPLSQYKRHEAWKGETWRAFLTVSTEKGLARKTAQLGMEHGVIIGVGVLDTAAPAVKYEGGTPKTWAEYDAARRAWLLEDTADEAIRWLWRGVVRGVGVDEDAEETTWEEITPEPPADMERETPRPKTTKRKKTSDA